MSSAYEAAELIQRIAEPRPVGDSVKAAIGRAAGRLGWPYSRTKDVWYQDARRIDAEELDALRRKDAQLDWERAVESVVGLRERLAATDADFHRETIGSLDRALRSMGAEIRSDDEGTE